MSSTEKAKVLIKTKGYNKRKLAIDLSISRPTLNSRLENEDWKPIEQKVIDQLYEQINR